MPNTHQPNKNKLKIPFNILKYFIFAKNPEMRKNQIEVQITWDDVPDDPKKRCAISNNQQIVIDYEAMVQSSAPLMSVAKDVYTFVPGIILAPKR